MGENGTHFGSFPFPPFFLGVTNFCRGRLTKKLVSKYLVEKWWGNEVSGAIRKIGYFLGLKAAQSPLCKSRQSQENKGMKGLLHLDKDVLVCNLWYNK